MYLFNKRLHRVSKAKIVTLSIFVTFLVSCSATKNTGEVTRVKSSRPQMLALTPCPAISQELRDPATISATSSISTNLTAKNVAKCINGKTILLQSYVDSQAGTDSRPVGPAYILDVKKGKPGPVLKIAFANALSNEKKIYDCGHKSPDVDVCTNLHTHGLHVSPKSPADNVLLKIPPLMSFKYKFEMPENHAPGTHWIHPHLHGSTAPQVKYGMVGALILKGEVDAWLDSFGIEGSKDKIMILQQLEDENNTPLCGKGEDGNDRTTSINGQCLPIINVVEGDVHHWRLIHAGVSATVNFAIETITGNSIPFYEYAKDGINLGQAYQRNSEVLQPGYRSDILVQFPSLQTLCPGQTRCELNVMDGATTASKSLYGEAEPSNVIAKVIVNLSNNTAMMLPPLQDPHWHKPYPEITDKEVKDSPIQNIWFANEPNPNDPNSTVKTVNGFVYPEGEPVEVKLGTAQTWRLWVGEKQESDAANHPYHIHVNPFEVIVRDSSGDITERYWKDTLLVSASENKGEDNSLEIRTRYETFDGEFVLHCHNLNHEDAGMMKNVKILK